MHHAPHEDPVRSGKLEIIWSVWFLLLFAGVTLGLTYSGSAQAAHDGKEPTCEIQSPQSGSVFGTGTQVDFVGRVTQGKKPYFVTWDFGDGNTLDQVSDGSGTTTFASTM